MKSNCTLLYMIKEMKNCRNQTIHYCTCENENKERQENKIKCYCTQAVIDGGPPSTQPAKDQIRRDEQEQSSYIKSTCQNTVKKCCKNSL